VSAELYNADCSLQLRIYGSYCQVAKVCWFLTTSKLGP